MPGFIRRYGYQPGLETLTQIEGVVIIDLPPPGTVRGIGTGTVGMTGEFPDMRRAVAVDGSGHVSTAIKPVEIFSSRDLLDKVGGFDATLGDFGQDEGNGWVAVTNKRFSRLLVAPVNLASTRGARVFRDLPLCTTATNTLPVVPMASGVVAAGREFRNTTAGRLLVGAAVSFTALGTVLEGTGGVTALSGTPAAVQPFTVAGATFTTTARPDGGVGIKKGDIIVIGYNTAGAVTPAPGAGNLGGGTYRVAVDAASATILSLERLDGADFDFVAAATIPFRVHVSSDADSALVVQYGATVVGGYAASEAGGYSVPVRPLTDTVGAGTDGDWAAALVIIPAVVPPALTGSTWNPLSGLGMRLHVDDAVAFVAALQKPNAPAANDLDAVYLTALDALISDIEPVASINIVFSARTSTAIRSALKTNAVNASQNGLGRMALVAPALTVVAPSVATGAADPGVGATRDERVIYTWPGARTRVQSAINVRLKTADGLTTLDGVLDTKFDSFYAGLLSVLNPELNPGQGQSPVPESLVSVLDVQRGLGAFDVNVYTLMKAQGVSGLRIDRTTGPVVQSGITSSLISGETNVNRRRMADFIEDSVAEAIKPNSKLPMTQGNRDNVVTQIDSLLAGLKAEDTPDDSRIEDYEVDDRKGNTPQLAEAGVFVVIGRVRMYGTMDVIAFQAEVGNNVVIVTDAA